MECRPDSGSTLIELLISITIVGVILVIIMGAFRISIRAWETGERDVESFQRQQIVLSILKRQLASVCNCPIAREGEASFVFKGEPELIDFISSVSVIPGNDFGKVRVTYRIGQNGADRLNHLEVAERNILTGAANETIDALDDGMIHELVGNAYDIRFEYLKESEPGEENQWQPEWSQDTDGSLPAAVKCILQMDEHKPAVTVVARVLSREDIS